MNPIKSVLITGGTGTFGLALVRFLLSSTAIPRIVVYSRGEHAQAALAGALGNDSRLRLMVGDVRDLKRLQRACRGCDTIIHAAALKRIETGAYNPDEVAKTNIFGTMNVIEAAIATPGIERVVNLSSDKAYQPLSPYGQSKAMAESLMLAADTLYGGSGPRFACTRYGNIWKAQGSVVPKWIEAVNRGEKEITVTDQACTRFFMTIEEAVDLVWNLAETMEGGELIIPSWLPAYRLGDLAQAFCEVYQGVNWIMTGLPQFEKVDESMDADCCSKWARRMTVDELKGWLQ